MIEAVKIEAVLRNLKISRVLHRDDSQDGQKGNLDLPSENPLTYKVPRVLVSFLNI